MKKIDFVVPHHLTTPDNTYRTFDNWDRSKSDNKKSTLFKLSKKLAIIQETITRAKIESSRIHPYVNVLFPVNDGQHNVIRNFLNLNYIVLVRMTCLCIITIINIYIIIPLSCTFFNKLSLRKTINQVSILFHLSIKS